MQPLGWYVRRLKGMGAAEIAWRIRSEARDLLDRGRIATGLYPHSNGAVPAIASGMEIGFRVADLVPGEWASPPAEDIERQWHDALIERARRIMEGKLTFFDLWDRYLGDPIDWNRDHDSGKKAPMSFAPSVDYRDYSVTGDAKVVWEPNRHHQLVVLGRAYRASGDVAYAEGVTRQLESWMSQCPFGRGMHWRSPLELAIRLINWVWAIDLIRESGLVEGDFRSRLLRSVSLHLWEISRKYSRGSSANNHLIGEAAGVFIAATYFRGLNGASGLGSFAREILLREIETQTYPDGCGREQAFGYHLFILQFFLFSGIAARNAGADFPSSFWSRVEAMIGFAAAMAEGGPPPMFGDSDDGYVLDLGAGPCDVYSLLSAGAVLFGRPDFKAVAGKYAETVRWLLGRGSRERFVAIPEDIKVHITSKSFPETGLYLLQCGKHGEKDRVSVVFDCGELGYKSIAAHGHADALSFTLRAFGVDIFVDPGTYDYFKFPGWRDYFRSTRAHNTVVIDGADQSEMIGPFLWGARANARCIDWKPEREGGAVSGEHDGYLRRSRPVLHRRTLNLDGRTGVLTISDSISARGGCQATICFHMAENCTVTEAGDHRWEIAAAGGSAMLEIDARLAVQALKASLDPMGGWVSRGYHHLVPATSIFGSCTCDGDVRFLSRVTFIPR